MKGILIELSPAAIVILANIRPEAAEGLSYTFRVAKPMAGGFKSMLCKNEARVAIAVELLFSPLEVDGP